MLNKEDKIWKSISRMLGTLKELDVEPSEIALIAGRYPFLLRKLYNIFHDNREIDSLWKTKRDFDLLKDFILKRSFISSKLKKAIKKIEYDDILNNKQLKKYIDDLFDQLTFKGKRNLKSILEDLEKDISEDTSLGMIINKGNFMKKSSISPEADAIINCLHKQSQFEMIAPLLSLKDNQESQTSNTAHFYKVRDEIADYVTNNIELLAGDEKSRRFLKKNKRVMQEEVRKAIAKLIAENPEKYMKMV